MGWIDNIFNRNKELSFMYDFDLIEQQSRDITIKQTAIESVIGRMSRTIAMSDIYVKEGDRRKKDTLYYRLNVMPNKNESKSDFIYKIVKKMLLDGECLVIQNDTNDLLVADDFEEKNKAIFGNTYHNVTVGEYTFKRTFQRDDVLHFKYSNQSIDKLMNGLYSDYGELLGRMIEFQLKKNQLRATVDIDSSFAKDEASQDKVTRFINRVYEAFEKRAIAIIPQQKGLEYQEHSSETGSTESVDEVKKTKNQYLHEVANAVGYPVAFLNGDIAELDKITKNYLKITIDPIIDIIETEMTKQLFTSDEYLKGSHIEIRRVNMRDIFDLVRNGSITGNELRDYVNYERGEDERLDDFYVAKDYKEQQKGGEED